MKILFVHIFFIPVLVIGFMPTPCFGIDFLKVDNGSDTSLLPYKMSTITEQDFGGNRIFLNKSFLTFKAVSENYGAYILAYNPLVIQRDMPMIFSLIEYPSKTSEDDPVNLTINDCELYYDITKKRRAISAMGYKNDSAYLLKLFPDTDEYDLKYITHGSDGTGDNIWTPAIYLIHLSDYDYDGYSEAFFYINSVREMTPRVLYCIEMETFEVEWQLEISSTLVNKNFYALKDSINPGVIFVSYNPSQGARDSIFSDRYGYLTVLNNNGKVQYNKIIAIDYGGMGLLPSRDSNYYYLAHDENLLNPSNDMTQLISSNNHFLSIIDKSGNPIKTTVTDAKNDGLWLQPYDNALCLFTRGSDNIIRVFNDSLELLAISNSSSIGDFLGSIRITGQSKYCYVFNDGIYNFKLKKLVSFPFKIQYFQVFEADSNNCAKTIALCQQNRFALASILEKDLKEKLIIFYEINRTSIFIIIATLLLLLLITNSFRLKTKTKNAQLLAANAEIKEKAAVIAKQQAKEAAYKSHKALIASIAHRLRNSMSLAVLNSQTLIKRHAPEFTQKSQQLLDQIVDSLKLTSQNIATFSTYEKIEQEKTDTNVNLKNVIGSIIEAYNPAISKNNIEVTLDIPKDLIIQANEKHIHLIIDNLVKNSIEAFSLELKPTIKISAKQTEDKITIIYEDNGPGIPPDILQQLGTNIITTKPTTGLGIGVLSIHEVVKTYNGNVEYSSEINKGTEVIVSFPI